MDEEEMNKKVRFWKAFAAIAAIAFVISILSGGFGIVDRSEPCPTCPTVTGGQPAAVANGEPNLEGAKILGDPDAPVVIVEYADFECPFCERHYTETFGQIKENYIDTGKAAYVFKHYPLSFHQQAMPAALAAECANEQGKFWEMHDMLYENGVAGGADAFKTYAEQLGLKTSVFDDCMNKKKYTTEINAEMAEGQALGVKGTPGFIINGQLVSGAQPYSVFAQVIDSKLN